MANLEQQRAKHAWSCVSQAKGDLLGVALNAPALVMSNGLMQTLAFLQHKGGAHAELLGGLCSWLGRPRLVWRKGCGADFEAIMSKLFEEDDGGTYLRATEEALEWLKWVRHFAKAQAKAAGSSASGG